MVTEALFTRAKNWGEKNRERCPSIGNITQPVVQPHHGIYSTIRNNELLIYMQQLVMALHGITLHEKANTKKITYHRNSLNFPKTEKFSK